jgi:hypothetical protein
MRSFITSAVLGLAVLGGTVALPAKANASWLSEALHQRFDPAYYGPAYSSYSPLPYTYNAPDYYVPGYSYYYTPGYTYYSPGSVAPLYVAHYRWYGNRYYGHHDWHHGWYGHHGYGHHHH